MADHVHQKFTAALDSLIVQLKRDKTVLAAILCGSLSHDTVWEKSDIDLMLIILDDIKIERESVAIYADGVNVHAFLIPRREFRKTVEGAVRNSFFHTLFAKGRLIYTHDDSISQLCAQLHLIGERDSQIQLLNAGTQALLPIDKAHKWFVTRGDLDYSALWILYAATHLARIEVIGARQLADREVIPQALKLNPELFQLIYTGMLNAKKTRKNVRDALDAIDRYMAERCEGLFGPILEHLREVGEARSGTELETHFKRNFNVEGVTIACEYLADLKKISKVSIARQLTSRSNVQVEEMAFLHTWEIPDEY